ncbi:glycosyl transferase family 2 [Emticicia oligotrophica DSM 17448]|uniref:Glycosyl transferase family 2 n=1 Tax=Emticicia oligotrophica (strain DSM 17448 / CIP 109782 / MTCC 6937 / GPTSA100-15) TaxID=929562 RepID=A0ABN4ALE3_EMTOG|nr:glycosyltransferase [Emticicia oligotrophica]AFK03055.1 glycosyl transferase family 2 [Emticicia oligotrophica DSM 17448]
MIPKVSICVPTYNHEKYIRQMLDGALMQKTDFDFEIIIGDDASTDNNQQIIQQYVDKYPAIFRAFLHKENQGPKEPKEFGGRNNVLGLLKACKGDYVALCEGDDYWTDPLKLQKQVDFMETNPDYAICHHNMRVIYEDGFPEHNFNDDNQKIESTIVDILEDSWFIATASTLYRNIFREKDFVDWHSRAAAGDWALVIQLAATGKIHYIPETMGVYRKHRGGLSNIHSTTNLYFLKNRKQMFADVNKWLNFEYNSTIQHTLAAYDEQIKTLETNF